MQLECEGLRSWSLASKKLSVEVAVCEVEVAEHIFKSFTEDVAILLNFFCC